MDNCPSGQIPLGNGNERRSQHCFFNSDKAGALLSDSEEQRGEQGRSSLLVSKQFDATFEVDAIATGSTVFLGNEATEETVGA